MDYANVGSSTSPEHSLALMSKSEHGKVVLVSSRKASRRAPELDKTRRPHLKPGREDEFDLKETGVLP